MRAQRLARIFSCAVHDIEHALGNACLHRQLTQARSSHGREFTHLQHRRVAKREAWRDFPSGRHERHIPRRDQRAHAHGVEQRVVQMRGRGIRVAIDAGTHLSKIIKIICRARDELFARLSNHLPRVIGLHLCNLRHMRSNQIPQLAQELGALGCGNASPFREGLFCGSNGGIHFIAPACGDFSEHLLRGGVDGF